MSFNGINWAEELENFKIYSKEGLTYAEVGEIYGVSRERIRQVVNRLSKNNSLEWGGFPLKKQLEREKLSSKLIERYGDRGWRTVDDVHRVQRLKFSAKKANAKRVGIAFQIDFGDLYWPESCPVLGIPIDYFAEGRQDSSPSFDRLNPELGYEKGNVMILSWRANRIKNDGSVEEHEAIAKFMRQYCM